MKKMLTLAVLGVAAMFGTAAYAQSATPTLVANIPFDFTIGTTHFAAGTYEVRDTGGFLAIRDASGTQVALVRAQHQYGRDSVIRNVLQFRNEKGTMRLAGTHAVGSDAIHLVGE